MLLHIWFKMLYALLKLSRTTSPENRSHLITSHCTCKLTKLFACGPPTTYKDEQDGSEDGEDGKGSDKGHEPGLMDTPEITKIIISN